jgi:glucokinase
VATRHAGVAVESVVSIGLATPGPASAEGVLSQRGSTNFVHPEWASFDLRGGIVIDGRVVVGRLGFGGELGHVLVPRDGISELRRVAPLCNCGRIGDLESICSLTAIERTLPPAFLRRYPDHPFAELDMRSGARRVRQLADEGDSMCRAIFGVQAKGLGLFFDMMVNVFDPDVLLVGGRRARGEPLVSGMVLGRNPVGYAGSTRRAGKHRPASHAKRRYRQRPRGGASSEQCYLLRTNE